MHIMSLGLGPSMLKIKHYVYPYKWFANIPHLGCSKHFPIVHVILVLMGGGGITRQNLSSYVYKQGQYKPYCEKSRGLRSQ